MKNTKKKNYEAAALAKTLSDYALILENISGCYKKESREYALQASGETLYEELLRRNIELFKTGDIILV